MRTVRPAHPIDDRQPQPGAGLRRIQPGKPFHGTPSVGRGDSRAAIADPQHGLAIPSHELNRHLAGIWRVTQSIVQQIAHQNHQRRRITGHHHIGCYLTA